MLKSGKDRFGGCHGRYMGCSCCNSKKDRRKMKKILKRKEEIQWRKDNGY